MTPAEIRSFRKDLGLSQAEFALALGGVDPRTIRRWECGERDIPAPVSVLADMAGEVPDVAEWLEKRGRGLMRQA